MDIYRPKYGGQTYVAIPSKVVKKGCAVAFDGKSLKIEKNQAPVFEKTFADKFGRGGSYTLYYYIWTFAQPSNYVKMEKVEKKEDSQLSIF
jgi:hypothetical protein